MMFNQRLLLAALVIGAVLLSLFLIFGRLSSRNKSKGVLVVCKTCKGTGETEQDTSLLMAEALFAMWYNGHVTTKKCKICSKDKLCDIAQREYNIVMNKYKEIGPKIEKAACPDCMGSGVASRF